MGPVGEAPTAATNTVRLLYAPGYLNVTVGEKPLEREGSDEMMMMVDGSESEGEDEDENEEGEEEKSGDEKEASLDDDEDEEADEDDEDDECENGGEGAGQQWCFVHHCLGNDRQQHMMSGSYQVSDSIMTFPGITGIKLYPPLIVGFKAGPPLDLSFWSFLTFCTLV